MSNKEPQIPRQLDEALLDAAAAALKHLGWSVAVIGGIRIEGRPESAHHFQIAVKFTGSKPKELHEQTD